MKGRFDVLIPARSRSVGLPGKNSRNLIDRPLFLHSVHCGKSLKGVERILVSTDDPEVASIASEAGAYVPELRPPHLALGTTPMADVIRYATDLLADKNEVEFLLLLDPTSPLRNTEDIHRAIDLLNSEPDCDGVISISTPSFNPLWVGVDFNANQRIRRHRISQEGVARRQDAPPYWRVNGSFYLWRKEFCATMGVNWLDNGTFLGVETHELLSHSIDTEDDFKLVEVLLESGIVTVEWMTQ